MSDWSYTHTHTSYTCIHFTLLRLSSEQVWFEWLQRLNFKWNVITEQQKQQQNEHTHSCVWFLMSDALCVMCDQSDPQMSLPCVHFVCDEWCVMCDVWCVISPTRKCRYRVSISCVMSDALCVMCDVWLVRFANVVTMYLFHVWWVMRYVWCVMYDQSDSQMSLPCVHFVCDEWCVMCDVWSVRPAIVVTVCPFRVWWVMCDVWWVMCFAWLVRRLPYKKRMAATHSLHENKTIWAPQWRKGTIETKVFYLVQELKKKKQQLKTKKKTHQKKPRTRLEFSLTVTYNWV